MLKSIGTNLAIKQHKLTNEVNSITHFFQFVRTNVGTVRKAKVDQDPLAVIIGTLPCHSRVIHKIPRASNSSLAEYSCPLFFNSY